MSRGEKPISTMAVASISLDVTPGSDRLLATLIADASDIWLVELR